jgi:hypothetical protein
LYGHDCYMPLIHFRFKVAHIDSVQPSQPSFIERRMRLAPRDGKDVGTAPMRF